MFEKNMLPVKLDWFPDISTKLYSCDFYVYSDYDILPLRNAKKTKRVSANLTTQTMNKKSNKKHCVLLFMSFLLIFKREKNLIYSLSSKHN